MFLSLRVSPFVLPLCVACLQPGPSHGEEGGQTARCMRFQATTPPEAEAWQSRARSRLFELMMAGAKPILPAPDSRLIRQEALQGYTLEERTLKSLPDREVHLWIGIPLTRPKSGAPGILALHGHGGSAEQIIRGQDLYWYGKALLEHGYAVASLDLGQHDLQHQDWTLMGERTWDSLACLDYLAHRPEVNPALLGTIGLSLGGETVMYVAALDERLKIAVSSGWLTAVANMKNGHCPCFNFPGLEENFDFSDIFACVAPRHLVLQIGRKERAPGGFPVEIAQKAFSELQGSYLAFGAHDRCLLDVHDEGHVLKGEVPFEWIDRVLALQHDTP